MVEALTRSSALVRVELVWVARAGEAGGAFAEVHAPPGAPALCRRWLAVAAGSRPSDLGSHPLLQGLSAALASGQLTMAVNGRATRDSTVLRDGDRIELLGPIGMDAKEARRERVARTRAMRALPPAARRAA